VSLNRESVWTITLYTLIQSLGLAKQNEFGNLESLQENIVDAATWMQPECSYNSTLSAGPLGRKNRGAKFRYDPNDYFPEIVMQVIQMLAQDLVVIFDGMMDVALAARNEESGTFPQSKVEKLATHLDPDYEWTRRGCLELIAARNVLTHSGGKWNKKTITIVESFLDPCPKEGEKLVIGFPMLFRYRKAMRIFIDKVQ
jgi:hypothetical protein